MTDTSHEVSRMNVALDLDGKELRTSSSYAHRPSPYPRSKSLAAPYAIGRYLAHGWMPKAPFVTTDTKIVAFGSCFAAHISAHLAHRGYDILTRKNTKAYVNRMADGMVHTHAIRQQFEWAWENKTPESPLWADYDETEFGYTEEAREATRSVFDAADLFIITLGLSEIWYDEPTGGVFWRVPPKERIDLSRHKFRVATFAETLDNIRAIHRLIRTHRPQAKLVLTVSPIPLAASFRDVSAISANAASKAIIRAAVDEFFRLEQPEEAFYYPSYDAVSHAFTNAWGDDLRHIHPHILFFMMNMFEHYYCSPGVTQEELQRVYEEARGKDAQVAKGERVAKDENVVGGERRAMKRLRRQAMRNGVAKEDLDAYLATHGRAMAGTDVLAIKAVRAAERKFARRKERPRDATPKVADLSR